MADSRTGPGEATPHLGNVTRAPVASRALGRPSVKRGCRACPQGASSPRELRAGATWQCTPGRRGAGKESWARRVSAVPSPGGHSSWARAVGAALIGLHSAEGRDVGVRRCGWAGPVAKAFRAPPALMCFSLPPTVRAGPLQPLPLPPCTTSIQSLLPLPELLPASRQLAPSHPSHPAMMPPQRGLPRHPSLTPTHSYCGPPVFPTVMWVSLVTWSVRGDLHVHQCVPRTQHGAGMCDCLVRPEWKCGRREGVARTRPQDSAPIFQPQCVSGALGGVMSVQIWESLVQGSRVGTPGFAFLTNHYTSSKRILVQGVQRISAMYSYRIADLGGAGSLCCN